MSKTTSGDTLPAIARGDARSRPRLAREGDVARGSGQAGERRRSRRARRLPPVAHAHRHDLGADPRAQAGAHHFPLHRLHRERPAVRRRHVATSSRVGSARASSGACRRSCATTPRTSSPASRSGATCRWACAIAPAPWASPSCPRARCSARTWASARRQLKTMTCPFTGEQLELLPALNPDVALIHVQRCDAFGNAQLDGLQFMDLDIAMAAKRVIMTTERIVSNDQIRRTPDHTRIPFFTVEAVVEAPMGCAPHECYGVYEPFFSHLDDYAHAPPRTRSRAARNISRAISTSRSRGRTIWPSSAWMPCSMHAAAAGACTMTKHQSTEPPTPPPSCWA